MDAETVARVLSLIPDRVTYAPSGAAVLADRWNCRYAERIDFLTKCAHWMAPLTPTTKDEQRLLGLISANGRPMHASGVEVELEPEIPAPFEDHEESLDLPVEPGLATLAPSAPGELRPSGKA